MLLHLDVVMRDLAEHRWEREPAQLPAVFGEPLLDEDDVLAGLIAAAGEYRAGMRDADRARRTAERSGVRLYVDHGARMTDAGEHLPDARDGSVEAYLARVSAAHGGRGVELVVNDFQAYSPALWLRLRALLAPLYARTGMPADRVDAVLFLRDHAVGLGLHRDEASTFMFVLHGRKRVHLWPSEALAGAVDNGTQHYAALLDRALTLEAERGGAVYWPSSYFHCIEAEPGVSLSINVGLRLHARPGAEVLRALERADAHSAEPPVDTYAPNTLPAPLAQARERIARLASSDEFEDALGVAWDDRVSGAGFARVPPPLPVETPPPDGATISGSAQFPALLRRLSGGERVNCSANGRSFSVAASASVERLVARLNAGTALTMRALIASAEPAGPEEHLLLRHVVAKLRSVRTVEVSP
jgi:50S ribosomal protein L16 3-hydroxylase